MTNTNQIDSRLFPRRSLSGGAAFRLGAADFRADRSRPGQWLAIVAFAVLAFTLGLAWPNASHAALVGYWNFDEGIGTTAADSSGTGNNGTLDAGSQGGSSLPTWVTGQQGSALDFNGFSDRVVVPIGTSLNLTNSFTTSMWAKADFHGFYPFALLFTNDANGGARNWFFQGSANGGDQMYMWSDPDTPWRKALGFKEGGTGTADLSWHHYALAYDGSTVTPYVDGLAKTPQAIGGGPNFPSHTHLLIGGKNQNFSSWEGPIDDVGVFSDTQSHQRIALINGLGLPDFGVALNDAAIDDVLAVFNAQSGSAEAGGVGWEFATGLAASTIGLTGGSLAGEDAFIVLGSDIDGGFGVQMFLLNAVPEPSTLSLLGLGLLGLLACTRPRRR